MLEGVYASDQDVVLIAAGGVDERHAQQSSASSGHQPIPAALEATSLCRGQKGEARADGPGGQVGALRWVSP